MARPFRLTLIARGRYDRLVTVQHVKKMRREADRQTRIDLALSLGLNPGGNGNDAYSFDQ
jgi:hypothetical protein